MVIGPAADDADDPPEAAGVDAPVVEVLVLVLLLLPLHAARTPTDSATAPIATAFLENQGRGALTPGSSFLIAHASRGETSPSDYPRAHLRGYTGGVRPPWEKYGDLTLPLPARCARRTATIVCMRDWPRSRGFVNPDRPTCYQGRKKQRFAPRGASGRGATGCRPGRWRRGAAEPRRPSRGRTRTWAARSSRAPRARARGRGSSAGCPVTRSAR